MNTLYMITIYLFILFIIITGQAVFTDYAQGGNYRGELQGGEHMYN